MSTKGMASRETILPMRRVQANVCTFIEMGLKSLMVAFVDASSEDPYVVLYEQYPEVGGPQEPTQLKFGRWAYSPRIGVFDPGRPLEGAVYSPTSSGLSDLGVRLIGLATCSGDGTVVGVAENARRDGLEGVWLKGGRPHRVATPFPLTFSLLGYRRSLYRPPIISLPEGSSEFVVLSRPEDRRRHISYEQTAGSGVSSLAINLMNASWCDIVQVDRKGSSAHQLGAGVVTDLIEMNDGSLRIGLLRTPDEIERLLQENVVPVWSIYDGEMRMEEGESCRSDACWSLSSERATRTVPEVSYRASCSSSGRGRLYRLERRSRTDNVPRYHGFSWRCAEAEGVGTWELLAPGVGLQISGSGKGAPLVWLEPLPPNISARDVGPRRLVPGDPDREHSSERSVWRVRASLPWGDWVAASESLAEIVNGLEIRLKDVGNQDYAFGGHSFGASAAAVLGLRGSVTPGALILRSGCYNRFMTPAGFQYERRSIWEARPLYEGLSVLSGDLSREPPATLLIHGMNDWNSSTPPEQSLALFRALEAGGARAKFVQVYGEAHELGTKSGVRSVIAEEREWLRRWIDAGSVG